MSPATAAAGLVFTVVLAAGVFLAQPAAARRARGAAAVWAGMGLLTTGLYVAAPAAAWGVGAFALVGWYLLSAVAAVQGLRRRYRAHRLQGRAQRAARPDEVTW